MSILTIITLWIHLLAFLAFAFYFLMNSNEYNVAIDILDEGYTPFGWQHIWTLFAFYALYLIAKGLLCFKSKTLPPLTWVVCYALVIIGIIICIFIIAQTSIDYKHEINLSDGPPDKFSITPFFFYPLVTSISSLYVLFKSFDAIATRFDNYEYTNPTLNYLHGILLKRKAYPLAIVLSIFPVFFLVTVILMLFGQDYDSMVKVFTDTTTWRFSQKMHPPLLDHQGHYLCTVAAIGSPKIVKPVRMGTRHGNPIIVNRQLMVANAFEEVIQKNLPRLHKVIRKNYDIYGYNLSSKINTTKRSNLTYLLMKPLEWLFLIFLYLFCTHPEALIKRQYS
ncbi:DUF6688 domain-containing protein [Flagellimonas onchidii]|uniref:DUF6688 domain-containing protein n=1 Tax=Flagellimonas onchidii TaxID=2562684 RepID=UPI0010A6104A|nr:DUF6688 family protein [Allomuricauda onchidii]